MLSSRARIGRYAKGMQNAVWAATRYTMPV